jgi:methionyl-tRNA formyltransferase
VKRLVVFLGYDEKSNAVLRKVYQIRYLFDDVSIIHVPEADTEVLQRLSIPYVKIEFDEPLEYGDVSPPNEELDRLFVEALLK